MNIPTYNQLSNAELTWARFEQQSYEKMLTRMMRKGCELSRLPTEWELCGTALGMTRTEARRVPLIWATHNG